MSKWKTPSSKWKGGEPIPGCLTFLTYISVFSIFILSCVAIYTHMTALLGVLLLYLTNIIFSLLLLKDLMVSEKLQTSSLITFVFVGTIAMNLTSSSMVMMTFRKLHANYLKNDKTINLSHETRNIISIYLLFWISTTALLWILAAFYFIEPVGTPFYNYQFIGNEISPFFMFMGFFIKVTSSLFSLGLSGYIIYLAVIFSEAKVRSLL